MSFDELFEDFIKGFRKSNLPDPINDIAKHEAERIINMLKSFEKTGDISEEVEKQMDMTLGKPDIIEHYNEGNMFFEKRIWHTADGDFIKLIATDDPSLINLNQVQKPLEEQLTEAIEKEEYEKAAAIRDEIEQRKRLKNEMKEVKPTEAIKPKAIKKAKTVRKTRKPKKD